MDGKTKTAEAIRLLTDSIVAATCAIDAMTRAEPGEAERYIKSGYYGLDTSLTIARRQAEETVIRVPMLDTRPVVFPGSNVGTGERQAVVIPIPQRE